MADDAPTWGSATEHKREMRPQLKRTIRNCYCGCGTRSTHRGMANGVCLMSGCELEVRRWVRDGFIPRRGS